MAKEKKPYTRLQCEFVSQTGILSFPALEAGQAKAITGQEGADAKQGGYSYKCELVLDQVSTQATWDEAAKRWQGDGGMYKAIELVAWHEDPDNYAMHLFGRDGRFPRLCKEEMPKRDQSIYPYAINKFMVGFSSVYYPDTVQMGDLDLKIPEKRAEYDRVIASKAPGVVKFCDPRNPIEVARVEQENADRRMKGMPLIPESEYYRTCIRMLPQEYWPGCHVQIAGRAYWSKRKKTVLIALDRVLFVKTGERLVNGERSPDEVFGAYAPSQEMAPPPPSQFAPPPPPGMVPPPVSAPAPAWNI